MPVSRSTTLGAALAAVLLLAACGAQGDDPEPQSSSGRSDDGFPVTVLSGTTEDGEDLVLDTRPEAIVSLSPTATEMLFAVGAGDQVVAVDDQSDYPEGVPATELSGYTPNVEAVLGYEPDLVVTASDDEDLLAGLDSAGVPTLRLPSARTLDEAYSQVERVGAATGHVADAAEVVTSMRTDLEAAVASVPDRPQGLTYFHELDPTYFTVTGDTFIGEVYELFGMTSIADAVGEGDPYPQLSSEYVVAADPDLVMLSDAECCGITVEQVGQRAGWAGMSAVQGGRVAVVDEDVASRWGPRVVEFAEAIAALLAAVEPAPAG